VAVEDDLGPEGRMPGHLDGEVAPLRIQDVERVMVDVGHLLEQLGELAVDALLDLPKRGWGAGDQDQKDALADLVLGQVLLSQQVLALARPAIEQRDALGLGPTSHPAREAACQAHEMGVV
jgi:hypothetical protein